MIVATLHSSTRFALWMLIQTSASNRHLFHGKILRYPGTCMRGRLENQPPRLESSRWGGHFLESPSRGQIFAIGYKGTCDTRISVGACRESGSGTTPASWVIPRLGIAGPVATNHSDHRHLEGRQPWCLLHCVHRQTDPIACSAR